MTHPAFLPDVLAARNEASQRPADVATIQTHLDTSAPLGPGAVVTRADLWENRLAFVGVMRRLDVESPLFYGVPNPLWDGAQLKLRTAPDPHRYLCLLRAAHAYRYPQYAGQDYRVCGLARAARDLDHPSKGYRVMDEGTLVLIDPARTGYGETVPGFTMTFGAGAYPSTISLPVDTLDVITPTQGPHWAADAT